jgi:hypothetical protein
MSVIAELRLSRNDHQENVEFGVDPLSAEAGVVRQRQMRLPSIWRAALIGLTLEMGWKDVQLSLAKL